MPSFTGHNVRLLIVGLAPGLHGANRTGRPFTGDWAGDLLYATLLKHGLARGTYDERADDGLQLVDCAITNAVRCVPPQNKPLPAEIRTCRQFLTATIASFPHLRAILALGKIAHDSVCDALAAKKSAHPFKHGAQYDLKPLDAGLELSLLPLQHQYRRADRGDVRRGRETGQDRGDARALTAVGLYQEANLGNTQFR